MVINKNISLREFNTFGIDVSARYLVVIDHERDLQKALGEAKENSLPLLVLGGGSNILFAKNYQGLVLKNEILGKEVLREDQDYLWVRVGAGENWHQIVLWAIDHGWGGIENLSLIPGTVGAAPLQNIGAYGVEISTVFSHLEAIHLDSGKIRNFDIAECEFGYRYSAFKRPLKDQYIITRVVLKLLKRPTFNVSYGAVSQTLKDMGVKELSLQKISEAVIKIRQSKLPDPEKLGNAGSFFKNPVVTKEFYYNLKAQHTSIPSYPTEDSALKIPAGWLIEQCNWKGFREGAIGVHDKQALVLVNYGGARGGDLVKLSHEIQKSVDLKFGIKLTPEVKII